MLGNPLTDSYIDFNARIPFAHRVALISDRLSEVRIGFLSFWLLIGSKCAI